MHDVLIAAEQVTKTFPLLEGRGVFTVLQGVRLMVQLGGVALLDRSGGGKSAVGVGDESV
jgi:alpha-D-ribose 1-methylphosphonate 5-triphosphate synthase subunit PhnL